MPPEAPLEYAARIGGILYKNVRAPILYGGQSVLTIERTEDGRLAVSTELFTKANEPLATIEQNRITLHKPGWVVLSQSKRTALIETATGRVWFDINTAPRSPSELDCAGVQILRDGFPLLLHPDRTRVGTGNDNTSPNMSGFTMSTRLGSGNTAIALGKNRPLYLLSLVIENFDVGLNIERNSNAAA